MIELFVFCKTFMLCSSFYSFFSSRFDWNATTNIFYLGVRLNIGFKVQCHRKTVWFISKAMLSIENNVILPFSFFFFLTSVSHFCEILTDQSKVYSLNQLHELRDSTHQTNKRLNFFFLTFFLHFFLSGLLFCLFV